MNIAIIGAGYVGTTTSLTLAEAGHWVWVVDTDPKKINQLKQSILPFYETGAQSLLQQLIEQGNLGFETQLEKVISHCDVLFIAVGTPPLPNGAADLTYVKEAATQIGKLMAEYKAIVIKSTVPVGTCDQIEHLIQDELEKRGLDLTFDIISNPEFLREGKALEDARHPDRIVIGCTTSRAKKFMSDLYKDVPAPKHFTSNRDAEMIKYASNAFLATKISFINEMARLCEPLGADIKEVAKGMGMDHRIGEAFLKAGIGFGGSCFPKDVKALLDMGKKQQTPLPILEAVAETNHQQTQWFMDKIRCKMGALYGKRIALLGLTFKPETDDIREASSLRLIDTLLKEKADVVAYDPKGAQHVQVLYPNLTIAPTPLEAIRETEAILLVTEWKEIIEMDWKEAVKHVRQPYIFDGRNALKAGLMKEIGFDYEGVGYR